LIVGTFGAGGGTSNSAQALQGAKLRLTDSAGSTADYRSKFRTRINGLLSSCSATACAPHGLRAAPGT
jgi:hypothetical protein